MEVLNIKERVTFAQLFMDTNTKVAPIKPLGMVVDRQNMEIIAVSRRGLWEWFGWCVDANKDSWQRVIQ